MKHTLDRTKIDIREKAPKAEKIVHDLEAIRAVIKQLGRPLEARNSRRRANETGRNKSQQQATQQNRLITLKIAADLNLAPLRQGKISEAARRIRRRWPSSKHPSIRALCRYLTGK